MKTEVKWILEDYLWEDGSIERFEASLKKIGCRCIKFSPEDSRNGRISIDGVPDREDCVVFYGSLETAKNVIKTRPWIPGAFYTPENYRCCKYYPVFGKYLLNGDRYGIYPYGELLRMKDLIFEAFGEDRAIFIRPDDGEKSFTGQLILKENYEKDVGFCGFYGINPEALVVVSAPKNIVAEWRFFIGEGKVIAGSLYKNWSGSVRVPEVEEGARAFADSVCGLYSPDGMWVLDICKVASRNYYVLEIGCMSCAGIYACDTDKIAEVATRVAIKEFEAVIKIDEEMDKYDKEKES